MAHTGKFVGSWGLVEVRIPKRPWRWGWRVWRRTAYTGVSRVRKPCGLTRHIAESPGVKVGREPPTRSTHRAVIFGLSRNCHAGGFAIFFFYREKLYF